MKRSIPIFISSIYKIYGFNMILLCISDEIKKAIRKEPFDLVLLDIGIPSSIDKQLLCGEDIGAELRKTFPQIKIIVFTSYTSNYRLNNVLKSLNPEGFLIKSDVDFIKLIDAIDAVIHDEDGVIDYSAD